MAESALVATYARRVRASAERVWENVLDWEHLPYLHSQAFSSVRRLSGDANGWRGEVGLVGSPGSVAAIDVALDRSLPEYARSAATSAMGRLGDPSVTPALIELLDSGLEPRRAAKVRPSGPPPSRRRSSCPRARC